MGNEAVAGLDLPSSISFEGWYAFLLVMLRASTPDRPKWTDSRLIVPSRFGGLRAANYGRGVEKIEKTPRSYLV